MDEQILFYKGFPIFLNGGLYLQGEPDTRNKTASYFYPAQHGNWGIDARLLSDGRVSLIGDTHYTLHLDGRICNPVSEKEYRSYFNNESLDFLTGSKSFIKTILENDAKFVIRRIK